MKNLLLIILLFSSVIVDSQTIVVLVLPDNCNKTTSVEELTSIDQSMLKIYPSPNKGSFYVQAQCTSRIKKAKITISDLSGSILHTETIYCNSEILIKQIDLKEISNGTYILEMISEQRRLSKKFLIVK